MSDACVTCGREGVWLCSRVDCDSRAKHHQAVQEYMDKTEGYQGTDRKDVENENTKSY